MMKNILFIAKTPYQILVIMRLLSSKKITGSIDFILSDSMSNVDYMYEKISALGIFNNVKIYRIHKYTKDCLGFKKFLKCASYKLPIKSFWDEFEEPVKFYDEIYISSITARYEYILDKNKKQSKKDFKIHIFEDGFETYTDINNYRYSKISTKDPKEVFINKICYMLMSNSFSKISSLNVFSPDQLDWTPNFAVNQIEKISDDDKEFIKLINQVFDCKDLSLEYDKDVIFFEEGYFANGNDVGDVEAVNFIASIVGKENIMVKIHPRNPINRFGELGYKTNKNTAIPWEVIPQNIDLKNKILVTIASQAVLIPLLNMSVKPKNIIMLMNCKEYEHSKLTPGLPVVKKIASQYPDEVCLPTTLDEIKKYII